MARENGMEPTLNIANISPNLSYLHFLLRVICDGKSDSCQG